MIFLFLSLPFFVGFWKSFFILAIHTRTPTHIYIAMSSSRMEFGKQRTEQDAYEPTKISKEKYAKIVEGRNRFFAVTVCGIAALVGACSAPQLVMSRAVKNVYRRFCHGKVLDLAPKLYDSTDVGLYEMSRAVRVEYLVEKKVIDDGNYRIDETLTESDKEERRRAMTLDFMLKNDHHWVGSPVNFGVVERKATQEPSFAKYDCVLVRDDLMNYNSLEARKRLDDAATYMKTDGYFLVMDYGKSSYPSLNRMARFFKDNTNSSMCFTHDYHQWIKESMLYEVAEEKRCLFGFYYAMVLRMRGAGDH
ncbi:hypothetical protein STCU_00117 [Strigomonas culicis]|uniref:Methyltransferase n=1 Tax=Strigomonas culicis TaxID=28005 RepID=S9UGH4_9TRYP|nr:hypothetical protein STCU_05342 [Strigomonas culicis]EPY33813.1 hypothetical protein STCU_01953 [Strigomonas culicis]EPY37180.1 hypothetical protein STCU_00117 [Strigomonas culicis]|eukprot:EPY28018.1 hypothetical protein STCU_05342 [Strigomonas culicis]